MPWRCVMSKNNSPSCIIQKNKTTSWWRKSGESVEIVFCVNKTYGIGKSELWNAGKWRLPREPTTIMIRLASKVSPTKEFSWEWAWRLVWNLEGNRLSNKRSRTRHIGYLTFFKWVWKPGFVLNLARSNSSTQKVPSAIRVYLITACMHKQVPLNE